MKKKIGFIDHHLNNWHANNYVPWIREGQFKDEFDVAYAFGEAPHDGMDSKQWCEKYSVEMLSTAEEVVEKSDYLIVLSPDNPERHLDLARPALESGKATYVDKTFAPDLKTALEIVSIARAHKTPMFSTSALRFVPEIHEFLNGVGRQHPAEAAVVRGPNCFDIYAVHSIEPLVMLMGHGAESLSYFGNGKFMQFAVKYPDQRAAGFTLFDANGEVDGKWYGYPFEASVQFDCGSFAMPFTCDQMFKELLDSICAFFKGAPAPVSFEDTLEVMAIIDAGRTAMKKPGEWVKLGQR